MSPARSDRIFLLTLSFPIAASVSRTIGPALGGLLWSTGLRYGFTYINWIVMTTTTVVMLVLTETIPRRLESSFRRVDEE